MSDDAKSLIAAQAQLADDRSNFDAWWQKITQRVLPQEAQFTQQDAEGTQRTERLFTSKPVNDNARFAAVMDDLLTPRAQMWHSLAPADESLAESQDTKVYLERLNKLLFAKRYRTGANFAAERHRGYLLLGAVGNTVMFVDEEIGKGPRYKQLHMRECFWDENHQGNVDTLYRRWCMTGRQAVQMAKAMGWAELPERVRTAAEKGANEQFEFLHAVRPNQERIPSRRDYRGMPYSSHYVCLEQNTMLKVGGFTCWPFGIGRYSLGVGEKYARSPAAAAWPAILTLNEQKKTILRAGQKEVDPPVLLFDDGVLDAFNQRPGAANYGMMSADGSPLAAPFKTGANIPLGLELMSLETQDIEDSFLVSIFKVLAEHPSMTATQVLEIAQQKAVLLAPQMGRFQSEDLGPIIACEVDILAKDTRNAWIVDEMPDELRELNAQGDSYKVEYRSPMARMMRAQDGVAIQRTFESLAVAMQIDPHAVEVIDVQAGMRELAEINGAPAKIVRDDKMVQQRVQARQQAEAAAQMAQAAPDVSAAALNVAKAEQLRVGA